MKVISWGTFVLVILGTLVVLTPYSVFPICQAAVSTASGGTVPMKCFWSARATLGNGGLIIAAGLLLFFAKHSGVRLGIALMLLPVGLLTILTPSVLIGVCAAETMPCHMGTLPALSLLGLLVMLTAAVIAFRSGKALRAEQSLRAKQGRGNV